MSNILDSKFKYTPSFATDLKATFARVRREQKRAAAAPTQKVTSIKRKAKS